MHGIKLIKERKDQIIPGDGSKTVNQALRVHTNMSLSARVACSNCSKEYQLFGTYQQKIKKYQLFGIYHDGLHTRN
jgi:uncharacterized Zn-finger protein